MSSRCKRFVRRTWSVDGLSQWPFPVSLSDNVLNASKHDLIQITTTNKSIQVLLSWLIVALHTSADALSGRRLSYTVHFNDHKSPIQCDTFLPVMPLWRYLCRILIRLVAGWCSSNLWTWTSASVRLHVDRVTTTLHTHLFSDITAVWRDGGDGHPAQSNLRSHRPAGVAGSTLFSDWLKATSFRKPSWQRSVASRVASVCREPRAARAGQIKNWF